MTRAHDRQKTLPQVPRPRGGARCAWAWQEAAHLEKEICGLL
jgi:hypothetical protein